MHKLLAMILAVAALLGLTAAAGAQDLYEPQMQDWQFTVTPSASIVLPVGVYGTFSCLGSDIDNYGDPLPDDEDGVHAAWNFGSNYVTDPANTTTTRCNDCEHTQYPMSVQCKWMTSGVKSVGLSVDDDARFGDESDDEEVTLGSISVTVVEAASISGPTTVNTSEWAMFTGYTSPSGHADMLAWTGGGADNPTGSGATFMTRWNLAGQYTIHATCGTSDVPKTITVVDADKYPPIVAGSVNPQDTYLAANQTYGNAYDYYWSDAVPSPTPRWTCNGYDKDTLFDSTLVDDPVKYDFTYGGADWVSGMLVWSDPGVYQVDCVVSDRGLRGADDLTHPSAVPGSVTVIGGTIESDWGLKLYVWYDDSRNVDHRMTFSVPRPQPTGISYSWDIAQGLDKVHIIGDATDESVVLEPHAASVDPGDVVLRVTYTYQTVQAQSSIGISVLKPSPAYSHHGEPAILDHEPVVGGYATGLLMSYVPKDQFGELMPGKACWSETLTLSFGDGFLIGQPTVDQPVGNDGTDCDLHGIKWPYDNVWYFSTSVPYPLDAYVGFWQDITWNGWGSGNGNDPFWQFYIEKYISGYSINVNVVPL